MDLLTWLIVGLIAGVLASLVMGGTGYGLIGDIIIGIVGLLILRFFLQVARGATSGAYGEQNLARALRIYFGGLRGEMRNKVRGPRA